LHSAKLHLRSFGPSPPKLTRQAVSRFKNGDEEIGPGKTKELTVTMTSPPTHMVSITSLNLEERDRFTEKIVIRVKFADGHLWQTP